MPTPHAVHLLSNPYTHDGRVRHETRSLVAAGYRVTVLAWDRAGAEPSHETLDGVDIVRLRHSRRMRRMPRDLLRLRGFWRLLARAALDLHDRDPIHVVHAHDLDTLPAGVLIKKRLGVPLIFDAHEVWPDMIARDLPPPVPQYFRGLERRSLPHVDALVTVNEPLKAYYTNLGVTDSTVVMNAKHVTTSDYQPPPHDTFRIAYHGTLTPARFVVEAIEALNGVPDVEVEVAGSGKPDYVARVEAASAAAPNATYLGLIPSDEIHTRTLAAHAVLCLTDPNDRNNRRATANKQFEAMAAGRPVICSAGTYPGRFTEEHDIGLAVDHDAGAVRSAVVRLRDDPPLAERLGHNALQLARNGYDWATQAARLVALYERLTGPSEEEAT